MAALTWTNTELLADIRSQGRIADDDPEATDAILLTIATSVLHDDFVPMLRTARAEWYTASKDTTVVRAQVGYDIPARAFMSSVRTVLLVDSANREYKLYPKPAEDRHVYTTMISTPNHYTIYDDQILLLPSCSDSSRRLRLIYEYRPGALVLPSACAEIQAVTANTSTGYLEITVSTAAAGALGLVVGNRVDILRATSPFSYVDMDATVAVSATTGSAWKYQLSGVDLTGRLPNVRSVGAVGDWLCPVETSPVPQLPADFHSCLALAVAAKWLEPIDLDSSGQLSDKLSKRLAHLVPMLAPRQQGTQMKVKSTSSMMRRTVRRRGGTFGDWR